MVNPLVLRPLLLRGALSLAVIFCASCGKSDSDGGPGGTGGDTDVAGEETGDSGGGDPSADGEEPGADGGDPGADGEEPGADGEEPGADEDGELDGGSDADAEGGAAVVTTVTPAEGGELVSDDGRLSLVVSPGAVDEPMEIGIRLVPPDEVPPDLAAEAVSAVYELTPGGATFEVPVQLGFEMSLDEVRDETLGGIGFHIMRLRSSDGTIETVVAPPPEFDPGSVPAPRMIADLEAGTVTLVGETRHFSLLAVARGMVRRTGEDDPGQIVALYDGDNPLEGSVGGAPLFIETSVLSQSSRDLYASMRILVGNNVALLTTTPTCNEGTDIVRLDGAPGIASLLRECETVLRYGTELNPIGDALDAGGGTALIPPHGLECAAPGETSLSAIWLIRENGSYSHETDWELGNRSVAWLELHLRVACSAPPPPRCATGSPQTDALASLSADITGSASTLCEGNLRDANPAPTPHSASAVTTTSAAGDHTQSFAFGASSAFLDEATVTILNELEGGCSPDGGGDVICANPLDPLPPSDYLLVSNVMQGTIPLFDPVQHQTFAFVFDSDGNPADNFTPEPEFPNDFYGGADLWYQAIYDPATGWMLFVNDASAGFDPVPSQARVLIRDNVATLVVPASEMEVPEPAYRVTAFQHGGDLGMVDPFVWSGDAEPPVAEGLSPFAIIPPDVLSCDPLEAALVEDTMFPGSFRTGLVVDPDTGVCGMDPDPSFNPNRIANFLLEAGRRDLSVGMGYRIEAVSHGANAGSVAGPLPDATPITAQVRNASIDTTWEFTFRFDTTGRRVLLDELLELH